MKPPPPFGMLKVLVISLATLATSGCGHNVPSCSLDLLLINASMLPNGDWVEVGSRDERGAPSPIGVDRIGQSFSAPAGGGIVQIIYRFGDGSEAINQFPELSENWFLLMPQGTTCDFDPALARSSPQPSQATPGLSPA